MLIDGKRIMAGVDSDGHVRLYLRGNQVGCGELGQRKWREITINLGYEPDELVPVELHYRHQMTIIPEHTEYNKKTNRK